jgi:hypothetical protein
MQLAGVWENEHGSIMEITVEDGRIEGLYSSHTGETGTYRVVGIDGEETLTTMWLLTKPTPPEENWTSMLVDKSIFKRRDTHNA